MKLPSLLILMSGLSSATATVALLRARNQEREQPKVPTSNQASSEAAVETVDYKTTLAGPSSLIEKTTTLRQRMDIAGGTDAESTDAPFYCAIMKQVAGVLSYRGCGCSLISPRHVLTAAHCVNGRDHLVGSDTVIVGAYRPFEDDNGSVDSHQSVVQTYKMSPLFNNRSLANDVAIVTMADPIPLQDLYKFSPIALADQLPDDETIVTVYGLGDLFESYLGQVDVLQKVDLEFISGVNCIKYHGTQFFDPVSMVCAGFWNGVKDACQGDSGGPLVWKRPDGSGVEQVGVVSWGKGCARVWSPGVYTSVPHVKNWVVVEVCRDLSQQEKQAITLCPATAGSRHEPTISPSTSSRPSMSPSSVPSLSMAPSLLALPTTSPFNTQPGSNTQTQQGGGESCANNDEGCSDNDDCCGALTCQDNRLYMVGMSQLSRTCQQDVVISKKVKSTSNGNRGNRGGNVRRKLGGERGAKKHSP